MRSSPCSFAGRKCMTVPTTYMRTSIYPAIITPNGRQESFSVVAGEQGEASVPVDLR